MASFIVNGQEVSPSKNQKLLRFLRDELHITSAKDGCSEGACGACTVIIDTIPEEYQHLIADLVAIIDEKETTTETAEIEDETLPPIPPEETEQMAEVEQMTIYGPNEGWNLAA